MSTSRCSGGQRFSCRFQAAAKCSKRWLCWVGPGRRWPQRDQDLGVVEVPRFWLQGVGQRREDMDEWALSLFGPSTAREMVFDVVRKRQTTSGRRKLYFPAAPE